MKHSIQFLSETSNFIKGFISLLIIVFSAFWRRPFYYRLLIKNIYDFAYRSLFIVVCFGLAVGSVLTLNFGLTLKKYGAVLYVPKLVMLSLLSEVGTVVVVFLLAGKIGAGITSEIASMKISEQLDAFRALGVSPIKRVVVPKVLACLITIPILCILVDFIGFFTSAYVGKMELQLDPIDFLTRGFYAPPLSLFLFGIFKTVVFALAIAITSCHYGLNVTKGSYEIGKATMRSIVTSFIIIIILNMLLTKFYYSFLWPGSAAI